MVSLEQWAIADGLGVRTDDRLRVAQLSGELCKHRTVDSPSPIRHCTISTYTLMIEGEISTFTLQVTIYNTTQIKNEIKIRYLQDKIMLRCTK